jgi:hypothetical protein
MTYYVVRHEQSGFNRTSIQRLYLTAEGRWVDRHQHAQGFTTKAEAIAAGIASEQTTTITTGPWQKGGTQEWPAQAGSAEGKNKMADDFDAPLDDSKEYSE